MKRATAITCAVCLLLAASLFAQRGGLRRDPNALGPDSVAYNGNAGAVVVVTAFAEDRKTRLNRQSVVKLFSAAEQIATWQPTNERSEAVFGGVPYGPYEVEVSAVGYLSAHQELQVGISQRQYQVEVVLQHDPSAVDLSAAEGAMPSKARKDTKRAISALRSGNLAEARKDLDKAYRLYPASSDLNFLLGYLYFQENDFGQAETYLGHAATLNPHHLQALTLLGRVELEKEDFGAARSALEQAIAADAEYWLPHGLLADAYLKQHNYERASDEAQVALQKGKKGASAAQLVLGQALINLGRDKEGIQALQMFLQDSPGSPTVLQVRNLIDEVVKRDPGMPSTTTNPSGIAASVSGVEPLLAVAQPALVMTAWKPPGIDEIKPSLAAGVVCPYEKVIDESGDRVKQLVDNVARFAAVEDLLHQRLDEFGNPTRIENRKFNYVASISEPEAGVLLVDEYRADRMSLAGYPDQIASTGLAVLALVFHPHMRDNFEMKCEGLGDWHGQASWLVRFQQRDDKPANIHGYKVGNELYPVKLKGRAWITADNFQIVRIESELVSPMPEIKLLAEHQIVEYGPVPFQNRNTELWLPKSAEIYFDFRKHRFYRRHSFDHYMLFSVDADEKPNERKAKLNPTQGVAPPPR